MKASELRIGNLVNYTNGGIFKVIGIHDFGLDVEDEIEITYMELENFEPIPLTEEWLLKCGFEKEFSDLKLLMQRARIGFIFYGGLPHQLDIVQDGKQLSMFSGCCIYIHQLQNLYFALTGQELTIKTEQQCQQ